MPYNTKIKPKKGTSLIFFNLILMHLYMLNHMVKHNKILKEEKFTSIKDIVEREDTTRKTSSNP